MRCLIVEKHLNPTLHYRRNQDLIFDSPHYQRAQHFQNVRSSYDSLRFLHLCKSHLLYIITGTFPVVAPIMFPFHSSLKRSLTPLLYSLELSRR